MNGGQVRWRGSSAFGRERWKILCMGFRCVLRVMVSVVDEVMTRVTLASSWVIRDMIVFSALLNMLGGFMVLETMV